MTGPGCLACGVPLPPPAGTGRRRRYCSGRCREAARRDRNALGSWEPLPDPVLPPGEDLAALDALVDEANAAPPEDRLARAVLETRNLSHGFRTVAREVRPALAVRAQSMAQALDEAVDRNFGGTS